MRLHHPARRQVGGGRRTRGLSPDQGDRQVQAPRTRRAHARLPALDLRQGVEEDAGRRGGEEVGGGGEELSPCASSTFTAIPTPSPGSAARALTSTLSPSTGT